VVWLLINNFNAAAVEQRKIYEINHRILVEVCLTAPIRLTALGLEPIGCKHSQALEIVVDYLNCVRAVKLLATGECTQSSYFNAVVFQSSTTETSTWKSRLDLAAAKYAEDMSSISSEAMKLLEAYDWPGNVRQLEHLIGQIVITNNSTELTAEMLPPELTEETSQAASRINAQARKEPGEAILSIQEMERSLILQALELTSGSVREAARHLGLSEATLYRKIKKFGISRTFVEQQ
jgi:DNA-binding protein Fis